jgi:protein arginine N-methyltransferase 2
MPRRSATPSSSAPTSEATLISLANQLISAAASSPLSEVKRLIKAGAPTWYQEDTMGWSALHFAAERADSQVVKALLDGGAVWNASEWDWGWGWEWEVGN